MTAPDIAEAEEGALVADSTDGDVRIVTFGCRRNAYESEVIRKRAAEDGLADAVVFNTCAVTGEAVRQARQAIRKARRELVDRAATLELDGGELFITWREDGHVIMTGPAAVDFAGQLP